MNPYELEVELVGTAATLHELADDLDQLGTDIDATTAEAGDVETRIAALLGEADGPASDPVVERVRARLAARDCRVDDDVDLAALLDPAEAARIRRRFTGDITLRARLDGTDVFMAVAAGIVATIVDLVVTATPATSPLTPWLREHAVPSDNWLAGGALVPYDAVYGTGIAGLSPASHRVQTLGHDPLLGLIYGTRDILQGTLTGIDTSGGLHIVTRWAPAPHGWPVALATQVRHLLSDVLTPAGLPLPGWVGLGLVPTGGGQTMAAVSRSMYLRGYDSWHFMALAAPAATIELVCRAYWALRQLCDEEFAEHTGLPGDDPRYAAMTAAATAVAAAGDLAGFVASGGNPLMLNYDTWFRVAKDGLDLMRRRMENPATALNELAQTELDALRFTWPV